jgi:hypothetical protein
MHAWWSLSFAQLTQRGSEQIGSYCPCLEHVRQLCRRGTEPYSVVTP